MGVLSVIYNDSNVGVVKPRLRGTIKIKTRMWADAQRDGRPAEYRWRPLRKFGNSITCAGNIGLGERKTWT